MLIAFVKKAGILQEKTKEEYPFLIPDTTMMNGRLQGISLFICSIKHHTCYSDAFLFHFFIELLKFRNLFYAW